MSRIHILTESPVTGAALARAVRSASDLAVGDILVGVPRRIEGLRDGEILVLGRDLPTWDRLEALGQAWRSHHVPRILFVSDERPEPEPGAAAPEDLDLEPESRTAFLERLRDLASGVADRARISVRFRSREVPIHPIAAAS